MSSIPISIMCQNNRSIVQIITKRVLKNIQEMPNDSENEQIENVPLNLNLNMPIIMIM